MSDASFGLLDPFQHTRLGLGSVAALHDTRPFGQQQVSGIQLGRCLPAGVLTPRLRMAAAARRRPPQLRPWQAPSVTEVEVPAATSSPGCHLLVQVGFRACDPQSLNQRVP